MVTGEDLKVAHCSNVNCSSAVITVIDTTAGSGDATNITIGADGLGLISHYRNNGDDLAVVHCANIFCSPYFRQR